MLRRIHVTNPAMRNGIVGFTAPPRPVAPRPALPAGPVWFRSWVSCSPGRSHADLCRLFGVTDYAEELIKADPEVDLEQCGRLLLQTETVWLSHAGEVLPAAPKLVEVTEDPFGTLLKEGEPEDRPANILDESQALTWTGRAVPKAEAVRRFAFRRSVQLVHLDGVTYDFLHGMAKTLAESRSLMLLGSGAKGRDPLVLTRNGTGYRGFLEGRVEGEAYQLILHLSAMELKRPPPKPGAEPKGDATP